MTAAQQQRLEELEAKIDAGLGLNAAERMERQGILFNHSGKVVPVPSLVSPKPTKVSKP